MATHKLLDLIKSLKSHTVFIVENAFRYESDAEKIVGKFCLLKDSTRHNLLDNLNLQHPEISGQLTSLFERFNSSQRDLELEKEMRADVYFRRYLHQIGSDLDEDEPFQLLQESIDSDNDNAIKDILLKHGILTIAEADYDELIDLIKNVGTVEFLFYKKQPTGEGIDGFINEIKETCTRTNSRFILGIIDKKLETGAHDDEGKDFIKNELFPKIQDASLNLVCCLYTSTPAEHNLEVLQDYFLQEIGKDTPDKIDKIARVLATAAYAQVFNYIKKSYDQSAQNALDLVLRNQKNIKYIIEKSFEEGIQGYESIKYWFDLAHQSKFEEQEIKDLKFNAGLTSFFNENFLEDNPGIGQIAKDLKELNSFELFDFRVNEKYLPIAPGDIFQSGEDHYILMGQVCDTLLRKDNTRKAKIGELLKITLSELSSSNGKYQIKVNGEQKVIKIQNFISSNGEYKTLNIDVSTSTSEFADLRVLDLSMFNNDGACLLNLNRDINEELSRILNKNLVKYYSDSRAYYSELIGQLSADAVQFLRTQKDEIKFTRTSFNIDGHQIDFGLKRISHLKGRYYDSVYNNFLNNKGRIDLNLIDNSPEYLASVNLSCNFAYDETTLVELTAVNLWTNKIDEYFKRDELKSRLPNIFYAVIDLCPEFLKLGEQKQFFLTKQEDGNYKLIFKYYLVEKDAFASKSSFSYNQIFGEQKPTGNPNFRIQNGDEQSFLDENGKATRTLTVEELKRGVVIFSKEVVLKITNGFFTKSKLNG